MSEKDAIISELKGFYLEQVKTLVATKRYQEAREILHNMPNDTTKEYWLKEIYNLELYGESRRPNDFINVTRPPQQKQNSNTYLLDQTVMVFVSQNWKVTSHLPGQVIVEKRAYPPPWITFGLVFILGIAGFGIVGIAIHVIAGLIMENERVILETLYGDKVRLESRQVNHIIAEPLRALPIAQSVEPGLRPVFIFLALVFAAVFRLTMR